MNTIVSANWLHKNLENSNIIILDATLAATIDDKKGAADELCIPNSRFFDFKTVFVDADSVFPNTIPSAAIFEKGVRALGIDTTTQIVVYDRMGIYSSPRVWWLFNVMGHTNIAVLGGGLPNWIACGYKTEKARTKKYVTGNFKADIKKELCIGFDAVKENCQNNNFLLVDARSVGRFNGIAPEPRKSLKSGKIPNSVNIPYQDVLIDGNYKSKEELQAIFKLACKNEKNLVFSCGSGLTACIIMLAYAIAFDSSKKLYDGSWTEWASLNGLVIS